VTRTGALLVAGLRAILDGQPHARAISAHAVAWPLGESFRYASVDAAGEG
jgi:hypothetical protein